MYKMKPVLFVCLAFIANLTYAECQYCTQEDDIFMQDICFYKVSKNNIKTKSESISILNCMASNWPGRGDIGGIYLSDGFISQLEKHPQVFFDFMASHTSIYSGWLSELGKNSFIRHKKMLSSLEQKQHRLITFVTNLKLSGQKQKNLQSNLIRALKDISPGVIN